MLEKQPIKKYSPLRFVGKKFLIVEGVLFFGSYMLYAACNRSQTTRKFFHDHKYLNFVLKFYYTTIELYEGGDSIRKFDSKTWHAQDLLDRTKQSQSTN